MYSLNPYIMGRSVNRAYSAGPSHASLRDRTNHACLCGNETCLSLENPRESKCPSILRDC